MIFHTKTSLKKWGTLLFFSWATASLPYNDGVSAAETGISTLPSLFDTRERIAKPDLSNVLRIRFLTTLDFPPLNFLDKSGKLSGFQVDLIREICSELALADRCQIEAIPYDELQESLASGRGEAVIAGVRPTPELRRDFEFSRPFMRFPARFMQNNLDAAVIKSVNGLNGRLVGVVEDTVHQKMMATYFPDIKPNVYPDFQSLLAALARHEVGAVFSDGLKLSIWASDPVSSGCCSFLPGTFYSTGLLGEGASIMVKKSDAKLATAFDHALLTLERNGRLNELYLRYFPNGLF